jgi:hypothetical protein
LEEEHAGSLKKLSRLTIDGLRKPETRHESYSTQFEQVLHANERIADNGTQFGLALHAMHENLLQLANKMDTNRKTWKQQGLAAENKVQDAEKLAEKAKAKYDQLADDLDRVKTGDTGAGRKFGLKGPKSAAQQDAGGGPGLCQQSPDRAGLPQGARGIDASSSRRRASGPDQGDGCRIDNGDAEIWYIPTPLLVTALYSS